MAFTMNPYAKYHDGNSKGFIQLNKGVMINFKASEKVNLTPCNADAFSECMEWTSKLYTNYGYLHQFPPVSGFPELMFDEIITKYKIYCAEVGSPFPQTNPNTIGYEYE